MTNSRKVGNRFGYSKKETKENLGGGNNLEELLNKLIEKGWKPFGRETRHELSSGIVYDTIDFKGKGDVRVIDRRHHHIRELVSKESGLWQFVCENKLVETDDDYSREKYRYNHGMQTEYKSRIIKGEARKYQVDYEYRIIESALCNEEDLEKFLLDNIKV